MCECVNDAPHLRDPFSVYLWETLLLLLFGVRVDKTVFVMKNLRL